MHQPKVVVGTAAVLHPQRWVAVIHRLTKPPLAIAFAGELGGYRRQREPAFGRTQQPLTPEAIFNRHWVGFPKQQRHECFKRRPDAASVAMLRETAAPAWLEVDIRHARTMRAVARAGWIGS